MTAISAKRYPEALVEEWSTDGVVIWRRPGGPTICAVLDLSLADRAYHARLITAAPQLLRMLDECATRLEVCAVHDGTEPEYAAIAVAKYRDLIRQIGE